MLSTGFNSGRLLISGRTKLSPKPSGSGGNLGLTVGMASPSLTMKMSEVPKNPTAVRLASPSPGSKSAVTWKLPVV
ncbi:hypothetical protein [Microseira wollei]|uniref:hypothetical protein n=1 Tax=Microseira wollei TaxID=467598 RepID=UPI001CFD36AC|nr:hypothetical protein [Microseira wollei]